MITFFRRVLGSWVVIALLGLLMVAFVVTGVGTPSGLGSFGGGPGADAVATVDGASVPTAEVARRAQNELAQARQQQPGIDMAGLLRAAGGVNALVENYLTGRMLEAWAARHGFTASPKLIDGEIASIPGFRGPGGQFDEKQMQAVLAQQRMSMPALRDGVRSDLVRRQLLLPITTGAQMPQGVAAAYAALFIARREGLVGLVPARPDAVPAPGEAEIAAWYKGHLPLYSLPERRVIRYALMNPDTVTATAPTDAEIAARYRTDAAKYAAKQTRTLSQVVLPDEAAARALAAKVTGGVAFAKAAADAGFGAGDIALGAVQKADFARNASPAIADAAFAAKQGATLPPMKSALGWHVVHVDTVVDVAAKPLAAAHDEIAAALLAQRRVDAVAALGQKIQDAADGGATFDEIARDNKLPVVTSPPVLASGAAPADPAFKPDAALTALLKPAFAGSPDDAPTLEQVGPEQHFALLALGPVSTAAPQPLGQVHDRVAADLRSDRASAAARATAQAILARLKLGQAMPGAFAEAKLPAPQPVGASQLELAQAPQVPPALRTLFTLAAGKAAIAAGPGGWYVVQLQRVQPGPPAMLGGVTAGLRSQFGRQVGNELLEQFARAAQGEVTIRRNPAAVAALGRELTGQAAPDADQ